MFLQRVKVAESYDTIIEELTVEQPGPYYYNFKLKDSAAGRKLLAASPEDQRGFALAAVEWLDSNGGQSFDPAPWMVHTALLTLLRRRLPLCYDDVTALLDWSLRQQQNYWRGVPQMIKVVEDYLRDNELTLPLRERFDRLIAAVDTEYRNAETRKWVVNLRELTGQTALRLPLVEGEAWADAAIADIGAAGEPERAAWLDLLNASTKASGSAPSAKWLKSAAASIEKIGAARFKQFLLKWFSLVDKPRTQRVESWSQWQPDPNQMIEPVNADVMRALVWLCAEEEDREVVRALTALAISAYRKVPGVGPRCVRVGNACVWALGRMPGREGVSQLALLKVKVKFGTAQKGIDSALAEAAKRAGLPQDEIEEMAAPAYGLQEVGVRREQLGEFTAELVVTGTNSADLRWIKPDGKRQASVPQTVKEHPEEELKELTLAVKDIRKMLPAQAERIDNLYLEQKSWPFQVWRERYLDHPLVGTLARRLIWKFTRDDHTTSGVWHDGRMVGSDDRAIDWLNDYTQVELWHPIHEAAEAVLLWRDWLTEHEVRQPFKQAHREVYVLTAAEEATRVYSNRFAAHIIRQHQFNALCAARGWRNKLRLMVDDEYPPATRLLPKLNLRAEFWVEGVGENYGTDTNDAGTYYLTTDQVRFYPLEAPQHYAHAGGGGYHLGYYFRQAVPVEPLALDQIPPLVFSEIMRDVDMFVGVASVANDPRWADGGPEVRYREYWTSYSFGELSETAKTRRQVLERLVPRLKIAERAHLTDKFLVVRGDVRTYKIHLGSGNILMEPNDQYLCIVPARGVAVGESVVGKVFLPFEGDNTMAIILSKAFLLAEDWKIEDPTILRQISA
jgi:Domain of unknown function (DUF4132)